MGGGGSSGGQQIVQQQQIPAYLQSAQQGNIALSQDLGGMPYPMAGQPQPIAPFTGAQNDAINSLPGILNSWQPVMNNALSLNPGNAQAMQQYMSPYISQALQPQINMLNTQLAQQQNQIGAQAAQAGAFGDARQGAEQALTNFYGNEALNGLTAQGYNTAFQNAQNALLAEQGNQMAGAQGLLNMGLQGENALFNAGSAQQALEQQMLNSGYQNNVNAAMWPYQMLAIREGALTNTGPVPQAQQATYPGPSPFATGLGSFATLAGALGQTGAFGNSGWLSGLFGGGAGAAADPWATGAAAAADSFV